MMRPYEALGEDTIVDLVDRFYDRVAGDDLLRPLFPEDFALNKRLLANFLVEVFGGPRRYSRERSFEHLVRAHHTQDFTWEQRDAWISHMFVTIDELAVQDPWRRFLRVWFDANANIALNRYHRGERRPAGLSIEP